MLLLVCDSVATVSTLPMDLLGCSLSSAAEPTCGGGPSDQRLAHEFGLLAVHGGFFVRFRIWHRMLGHPTNGCLGARGSRLI